MPTAIRTRAGDAARSHASFADAGAPGPWLVVVPHDDDMVLGMGLTVQAAIRAGIRVDVAVATHGRMGYAEPSERATIVERRRAEMLASCARLGIPRERVHGFGLPDADLAAWRGRRFDAEGRPVGFMQQLVQLMRRLRPGTVFACTSADLHPDHQLVAQETAICIYHASGELWLELGPPIPTPERWDYAVYCPFPEPPTAQITVDPELLATKLLAIADFASQRQIGPVVEAQRAAGCQEYLFRSTWTPYQPTRYRALFAEPASGGAAFARDCAQAQELLAGWDLHAWPALVAALRRSPERPVLIIGEGSSRLFPAAFACSLAALVAPAIRLAAAGGRDAEALDLRARSCVLVSNSGRTRELVELGPRFEGTERPLALLGAGGGPIASLARESRALLLRPEEAIAATASVFAQALALAHAVCEAAGAEPPWAALRAAVAAAAQARLPERAEAVRRVWWCGSEAGPSSELALKTMETAGCPGMHAPGTMVLHGIEEVLDAHDALVVFAPDPRDRERMRTRIGATGAWLLEASPTGDIRIPDLGPWSGLPQLVAGWALLAQLAARLGRDPDCPRRARKVGNEATAAHG